MEDYNSGIVMLEGLSMSIKQLHIIVVKLMIDFAKAGGTFDSRLST